MQPPSGDARGSAEADALLARSDSAGRSSPVQSASPKPPGWGGLRRQSSFRHDVGHAASETYLVTRLTFTLLQCLGFGYRWMSQLLALTIYAILLMPGFLQVGYYYFFSSQVRRSIVYGEQPRNRLDLYIPKDNSRPCPVVAFVTGGAWIIGYKAWGALLGRRLAERGIIVACIDYRNFPQGTISDMVNDASQGISFVCNNIASYGGDPNQIYLMGQSAGAHIAACALMEQAVKESRGQPFFWSVTQIKAYFGLSGGYSIHNLVDHFHERGLYRSIFLSIMEGEESLSRYSPEIVAKESSAQTIALLPLIVLMHGTEDYSIPSSASQTFVDVLQQAGAQAKLLLYEGKTHTDLFIQVTHLEFWFGYRWMSQLLALTIYAILLMPGFLQVGYYYFFSSQVRRSIVYGEQPRNRLDLYIPKDNSRPCPVVAFVTGGAWIIGYKAWGALLGRRLAERGIIVACIDYRNFPQGTISDMVNDASQGISFVCNNIASYGGDPNQIYLMGQSAGAHIAACALMEQAVKESRGQPFFWSVTQIKAYFGLSGGYSIHNLVDHFHERGLYRSIFLSIMEGEESLSRYSPEIVAKESSAQTIALLPLIVLMHGTEDYSIPSSASQTFVDVLQQAGAQAKLLLYEGKTHTDLFIQDPLRGGRDPLVEDVLSVIHADDAIAYEKIALAPTPRRLVFEWQLQLARRISPF